MLEQRAERELGWAEEGVGLAGQAGATMNTPTVASSDMATHLLVDDSASVGGLDRGSRFFGKMLLYHAAVLVLSTLLTAAPIDYGSLFGSAVEEPSVPRQSQCTGLTETTAGGEDWGQGRSCSLTEGCMWCEVAGADTCVRYQESALCEDAGGYGYGYGAEPAYASVVVHPDLLYMPIVGLITLVATGVGLVGGWRRQRSVFAVHSVLVPLLCAVSTVCAAASVVMGSHESADCAEGNTHVCNRVAPYDVSVGLFVGLAIAHAAATKLHSQAGTYENSVCALLHTTDAAAAASRPCAIPLVELAEDAPLPATLADAHAEIRRLRASLRQAAG